MKQAVKAIQPCAIVGDPDCISVPDPKTPVGGMKQ